MRVFAIDADGFEHSFSATWYVNATPPDFRVTPPTGVTLDGTYTGTIEVRDENDALLDTWTLVLDAGNNRYDYDPTLADSASIGVGRHVAVAKIEKVSTEERYISLLPVIVEDTDV